MKLASASLIGIVLVAIVLGTGARAVRTSNHHQVSREAGIDLDAAKIFFEINATDGDSGIQMFLDGEGWDKMKVWDPDGKLVLRNLRPRLISLPLVILGVTPSPWETSRDARLAAHYGQSPGRVQPPKKGPRDSSGSCGALS